MTFAKEWEGINNGSKVLSHWYWRMGQLPGDTGISSPPKIFQHTVDFWKRSLRQLLFDVWNKTKKFWDRLTANDHEEPYLFYFTSW